MSESFQICSVIYLLERATFYVKKLPNMLCNLLERATFYG